MKRVICLILLISVFLIPSARALIAVNGSFSALVEENGDTRVLPGVFSAISKLTDDLFSVKNADNGKFALMSGNGEMLTDSRYTLLKMLTNGKILFEENGKYGVMEKDASPVISNDYTWLVENGEGGYLALRTDVWDNSPDGVYLIDETGYVSPTGVKVASFLVDFSDGLTPALSTDNGKYGYLNPEGQWQIRPQYAYADAFVSGAAVATLDSGSGVIDKNGSWEITPKYDFVDIGTSTIACVDYDGGITVFSLDAYKKLYSFDQDLLGAYVSVSGSSIIAYFEDKVVEFDEMGNEKISVSESGYLFPVNGGYTVAYDGNEARLVDAMGKDVAGGFRELDQLTAFDGSIYFTFVKTDGEIDDYLLGVIDQTGKVILNCEYTSVTVPEEGYMLCENESGMYLFTDKGKLIWQYEY